MADDTKDVKCFLRDTSCPEHAVLGVCRAWDGTRCILISLAEDLLVPKVTIHHPESAAPPEVKS